MLRLRLFPCRLVFPLLSLVMFLPLSAARAADTHRGYYRDPALHGDTVVFAAEGDLWRVPLSGGRAERLTSASGIESSPMIAPDGKSLAFSAHYEGPGEVYTMPLDGGLPKRVTWDGDALPVTWTPDGKLVVSTERYSTLPGNRLVVLQTDGTSSEVPLAEAAEAAYGGDGQTIFFTRWYKQPSNTKRYKGGWAESIWKFDGKHEAQAMTADYDGTSSHPQVSGGRVYFLSDRDGIMNVYSMDMNGHDVKQVTHQSVYDVEGMSVSDGHLVYACAADLWSLDLSTGKDAVIPVELVSDFDQLREHWVKKPIEYLTGAHISPDGSHAVFTARGEVFTIPVDSGRIVKVASDSSVRFRNARYLPDGKSIVTLSTASGETEFWKYPANGVGAHEQWTHDAKVLRWDGVASPDGNWLAHYDKDHQLWLYDVKAATEKRIAVSMNEDFSDLTWSPDSRWLAFAEAADNMYQQIKVLNVGSGTVTAMTSDRYNSGSPAWSSDGKWMYFLSDRSLKTVVMSPWGPREPEPQFDRPMKIFALALAGDLRSPFLPADELHPDESVRPVKDGAEAGAVKSDDSKGAEKATEKPAETAADKATDKAGEKAADKKAEESTKHVEVKIDFNGLDARLSEVPVAAGNYDDLQASAKRLCWLSRGETRAEQSLECLEIGNKGDEPDTVFKNVRAFEISLDRKKMLVRQKDNFYVVDAEAKGASLADAKALVHHTLNLESWSINTNPREEYRALFLDAWRLERDYFYDKNMHGVNWVAMRDRYQPLVDRVADRDELNDVIAQMVSELSALHTFVRGGDARKPADQVDLATLGAVLRRDASAGGFVVEHVYAHDADLPKAAAPLARPESLVAEGETITAIDGVDALSVPDERVLLRGKAGTQVLLHVKSAAGKERDVIVVPIKASEEADLRYSEWEYTRRLAVDKASNGQIGYVHLRAMGPEDIDQWARDYYPVFNRAGLIIDVRHNHGGNIDLWLLSRLIRQAWFYWQPRVGNPYWNMPYAFRGHIVVLCDHETASDGEAFSEGFRRLHLGKVIGTRTWGGEVWLSSSNVQADGGLASASEIGVYGPEGKWLIEGHGVDPDIEVDDLPHATFGGTDAQLGAALKELDAEIKAAPTPVPQHPPYPDKSFHNQK